MNNFNSGEYKLKIFRKWQVFNSNLWKSFFGIPVDFNEL